MCLDEAMKIIPVWSVRKRLWLGDVSVEPQLCVLSKATVEILNRSYSY